MSRLQGKRVVVAGGGTHYWSCSGKDLSGADLAGASLAGVTGAPKQLPDA